MSVEKIKAEWKVHTPNLLVEILNNQGSSILERPLQIFANILYKVSERASEINDPELNQLMARLTMYEMADPELKGHDPEALAYVLSDKYLQDSKVKS
jgi:hypothetical protein